GVCRAAKVQGLVVVDVCSPAHVGETRGVLVVAEIQYCGAVRRRRPRRAGEAERGQHCDGPEALVEVSPHHHSLRPAGERDRPEPVVMSAVCPVCPTSSRQRTLAWSVDILNSAPGPGPLGSGWLGRGGAGRSWERRMLRSLAAGWARVRRTSESEGRMLVNLSPIARATA